MATGAITFRELHRMLRKPPPEPRSLHRVSTGANAADSLLDMAALRNETRQVCMCMLLTTTWTCAWACAWCA